MTSPIRKALAKVAATWPAALGLAALACGALALWRVVLTISLRQPLQILTSGLEEEALFSIWKAVHGQAVYSDPFAIPFAASYFNWLFYAVYGSITALALSAGSLADEWIPTIAHALSLAFALLCIPLSVRLIREVLDLPPRQSFWLGAGTGVLVAFSPLVGWWNLTARPDIGALVLELLALLFCLRFVKTDRLAYLLAAIFLAFAAWSFRQVAVNVISGLCLYLLLRRRWRILAATVGLTFALYGVTFLLGGANYWSNTITCLGATDLYASHGWQNFLLAGRKSPLLLAGFAAAACLLIQSSRRKARPEVGLLALTWFFSILWNFLTSTKIGASDNYFFPSVALGIFFALATLDELRRKLPDAVLGRGTVAVLMLAQTASCLVVMAGSAGRIDLRGDDAPAVALAGALRGAGGPTLVTERWLNLPWINPTTPHFVYAYVYREGPLKNHSYEAGGLEGLIDRRYFRKIVIRKGTRAPFWPEMASNYQADAEDPLFTYYTPSK